MNERIKELANKAGYDDLMYEISKEGLDKFAELIVGECMAAVGDDPMAQPYIQRIKAKFGVEYYEPIEKAFGG